MTLFLTFHGVVQGVGFRPLAQRLALEMNIKGEVKNSGGRVEITAVGEGKALEKFIQRLNSVCDGCTVKETEDMHFETFSIAKSKRDFAVPVITPDIATCERCEKELFDKSNRRYFHPFISCVDCGPRYSIIENLPYDRENTSMEGFKMCPECEKEYTSVSDRRCHAQTICCNSCGVETNIPVGEVVEVLKSGGVAAIKDIGGYHLACRADCENAVKKIREIKGREQKPFAVMFKNINEINEFCEVSEKEKELLISSARPIVLLKKKKEFAPSVCKKSDLIGAFLPCNPIQLLILKEISPLVMTSANITSQPIITNDEEIKALGVCTLSHNREIKTPLDDSVLRVLENKAHFIRRSRGYVPLPIALKLSANKDILCTGGDLKASFCLVHGNKAYMSQYFGDLENPDCMMAYTQSIERMKRLHGIEPKAVVSDMHPGYFSSNLFNSDYKIQHHEAHCASVIAEHGISERTLCFAFDGTGFGYDGAVWGSEGFLFDGKHFERVFHLDYVKMLASDDVSKDASLLLKCILRSDETVNKALDLNINTVLSSSMGRLFDAVSAALGICDYNSYEGECAEALERAAKSAEKEFVFKSSTSMQEIVLQAVNANAPANEVALGFHRMIARLILSQAKKHSVKQVVLSGGVFANSLLLSESEKLLTESGISVYTNEKVPCNDGGIALGQAYIYMLNNQ